MLRWGRIEQLERHASHLPLLTGSQEHSAQQSPCCNPSCRQTDAFQRDCYQTSVFEAVSEQLSQELLKQICRLDIGLKYFRLFWSSPDFFKSGITNTCFNCIGTIPVEREALTIAVINGTRSSRHCFKGTTRDKNRSTFQNVYLTVIDVDDFRNSRVAETMYFADTFSG